MKGNFKNNIISIVVGICILTNLFIFLNDNSIFNQSACEYNCESTKSYSNLIKCLDSCASNNSEIENEMKDAIFKEKFTFSFLGLILFIAGICFLYSCDLSYESIVLGKQNKEEKSLIKKIKAFIRDANPLIASVDSYYPLPNSQNYSKLNKNDIIENESKEDEKEGFNCHSELQEKFI